MRASPVLATVGLVLSACAAVTTTEVTPAPSGSASAAASASDGPPACLDAKLVYADSLHRPMLVNCVDQSDLASVEQVWAWDGAAWELLDGSGPPANVVTGMGWDGDRDVLVRYGGIPLPSQECSPETWEWDTTEWRQVGAEAPELCDHHELAWDASAGRMLLVGGGRAQQLMPGTSAWDGTAWRQLTDAGPPPRAHHGFVADEVNAQVVAYGGLDNFHLFGDLWAWDGSAWEELTVEGDGPGPRSHHGLAAGPDGVLLFGGASRISTFGSLVDETWLLVDGKWSRLDAPGPSARGLPALGYDPGRGAFVLYGGFDAQGAALADTWEWDRVWRCIAGC